MTSLMDKLAIEGKANRFMVWRCFHSLKAELGRMPYAGEIVEDVHRVFGKAISKPTALKHCRELPSCGVHSGGAKTGDVTYAREKRVPDSVDLMAGNLR